jgi:death on curing protein
MRYLTIGEVVALHRQLAATSGGAMGIRNLGALEAAVAQPKFDGSDLYPTPVDKAAALGFSLVLGRPFVDGNKRTGHAAMETCLVLNGYELAANVDEQEPVMLDRARRLPPDVQRRAHRKLLLLNAARSLADLRVPPGNRLERLSGDRAGQYSIRVNEQWRICFRWERGDAHDVEVSDYH